MIKKGDRTPRQIVQLREVDGAELISLIDNSVDFLSTIEREEAQQVRKWVKESKGEEWARESARTLSEIAFAIIPGGVALRLQTLFA